MDINIMLSNRELKDVVIEVRESTGMNKKEFAEYFKIPYRTVQDWELGNRKIPVYLLKLIDYKIEAEGLRKVSKS